MLANDHITWTLGQDIEPKGKLTKEYVLECITSELLGMFTGHQGQVQKLTNFLEVLRFALFFAVKRPPALLLC